MNDLRTAAQQALECLKGVARGKYDGNAAGVCAALEAALAQQAEPVDTDCHTQGICQRSGYGITQQAEPVTSCGWLFRRNADGTIGIFAPPPKPGESQRTSDCVGPNNHDLHELLGKLADHMAAPPQQAEPVAWLTPGQDLHLNNGEGFRFSDWTPLYTAPPQRQPLTKEEIERLWYLSAAMAEPGKRRVAFGRAVERKVRGEEK